MLTGCYYHPHQEQSSVLRNDIAVRRLLAASPSSSNQKIIDATDITDRLVMSYLVYQGYRNTVLALRKDIQYTTGRTLQISHNGLDPVNPAQEETDAVERLGKRVRLVIHFGILIIDGRQGYWRRSGREISIKPFSLQTMISQSHCMRIESERI